MNSKQLPLVRREPEQPVAQALLVGLVDLQVPELPVEPVRNGLELEKAQAEHRLVQINSSLPLVAKI
jgi:hypothetical protein